MSFVQEAGGVPIVTISLIPDSVEIIKNGKIEIKQIEEKVVIVGDEIVSGPPLKKLVQPKKFNIKGPKEITGTPGEELDWLNDDNDDDGTPF